MEVIIRSTEIEAGHLVARLIADAIRKKPNLVLGLATGQSPIPIYAELVRMHREERLDFSRVTTFTLDEYVGLSPEHPSSYYYYINHHLYSKVNIRKENINFASGTAKDLEAECLRYEDKVTQVGGIDIQLLGLGNIGHLAFNEPLSSLRSRTRVKALTPATRKQNASAFNSEAEVPTRALTMGVGTILDSRWAIQIVTGSHKAEILKKQVEGPITAMVTGTALQLHPRCAIVCDEAAAQLLEHKPYYQWIFDNEPEWENYR